MAIVDKINWEKINEDVLIQQNNREVYSPVVSLYRWWARRPHAVIGAILDAAQSEFKKDSFVVADPFCGGGTVAFEAARRGLPVFAQDLYPWPSLGLAVSLTEVNITDYVKMETKLLRSLQPLRKLYWRKENDTIWEISHIIKVRIASCEKCGKDIYLFRDPFISLASRRKDEDDGFFGCRDCGFISSRKINSHFFICDGCGRHWSLKEANYTEFICSSCGAKNQLMILLSENIRWKPILIQEHQLSGKSKQVVIRKIKQEDPVIDIKQSPAILKTKIPSGIETDHLLRRGFKFWGDLYTHRQISIITSALAEIEKLDTSDAIKSKLRLAILGSCEMAANLCRWERYHPKAIEGMANHRYARSTIVVETNLLSTVGRGTIPRRLKAVEKALRWNSSSQLPRKVEYTTNTELRHSIQDGALVATGSSESQPLADGEALLVLTDPPYHDDVQYGEISRLFHIWLNEALSIPLPEEISEAVPNRKRGADDNYYREKVTACFLESKRTLSKNGRLVLTFHNKNIVAWTALATALKDSGFVIKGLAAVNTENAADHSKRGTTAFLSDLIIECIPKESNRNNLNISTHGNPNTLEKINLLAMGKALVEKINKESPKELSILYSEQLLVMGEVRALIR